MLPLNQCFLSFCLSCSPSLCMCRPCSPFLCMCLSCSPSLCMCLPCSPFLCICLTSYPLLCICLSFFPFSVCQYVSASRYVVPSCIFSLCPMFAFLGRGWSPFLPQFLPRYVKSVFPNAPDRPITRNNGAVMPGWFVWIPSFMLMISCFCWFFRALLGGFIRMK